MIPPVFSTAGLRVWRSLTALASAQSRLQKSIIWRWIHIISRTPKGQVSQKLDLHFMDRLKIVHKPVNNVTPAELMTCYKLVRRLRGMYIGAHEGWDRKQKISEMRDTPGLEYLIFFNANEIVAFASYTLDDRIFETACTFLWEIHVDPRFLRHGLGHKLLSGVCERARQRSHGTVMLRCFRSNRKARMFYEKEGFVSQKYAEDEFSLFYEKKVAGTPTDTIQSDEELQSGKELQSDKELHSDSTPTDQSGKELQSDKELHSDSTPTSDMIQSDKELQDKLD